MKKDWLILLILIALLLLGMLLTLLGGGERSRHGYGQRHLPGATSPESRSATAAHFPLCTGYPLNCQAEMPPYIL
jgi:hypothetical protein